MMALYAETSYDCKFTVQYTQTAYKKLMIFPSKNCNIEINENVYEKQVSYFESVNTDQSSVAVLFSGNNHDMKGVVLFIFVQLTVINADLPSCERAKCHHCRVAFISKMCPQTCEPCPADKRVVLVRTCMHFVLLNKILFELRLTLITRKSESGQTNLGSRLTCT